MTDNKRAGIAAELKSLDAKIKALVRQRSAHRPLAPTSKAAIKAVFEGTAALRDEFGTLERYTAYIHATESGLAKIHQPDIGMAHTDHAQRGDSYGQEARCKAEFEHTAALRDEFGTLECYTAYIRATEAGLAKVHRPAVGIMNNGKHKTE